MAGCSYGGYLPLWADINSAGNFYVYEWYPGQWTPSVRWWGWTWPGFKKGWFTGDVPGWHILSYNCRDWSNYVYIYVWPSGSGSGAYGSSYSSGYSAGHSTGASTSAAAAISEPLPSGAPTPPDPNAENLVLPDFNLLQPSTGQSGYAAGTASMTGTAGYSPQYSSQYPSQYQSQGTTNFPIQEPMPSILPATHRRLDIPRAIPRAAILPVILPATLPAKPYRAARHKRSVLPAQSREATRARQRLPDMQLRLSKL